MREQSKAREIYTLFRSERAVVAGTLAYCKQAAKGLTSWAKGERFEIRNDANTIVASAVYTPGRRMVWGSHQ